MQEKACKSTGAAKDSDLLPCRGSSLPLETLRALLTSLWSKRSCSEEEAGPRGRSLRAGEGRILRQMSSLRVCTKICAPSDRVKVLGQDHRWSLHPSLFQTSSTPRLALLPGLVVGPSRATAEEQGCFLLRSGCR